MATKKATGADKTLEDLFLEELQDMYDAEKRLVKALPKMAKAATSGELQQAINNHVEETAGHVQKLESVFQTLGRDPKGKKCEAMVGLIEEGDDVASEFKGSKALDAAIIAAAQKVEHYEIASYGCLQEWASLLGNSEGEALLQEILDEEKATDQTLTDLARAGSNEEAAEDQDETGEEGADDEEYTSEEDEDDEVEPTGRAESRSSGGRSRSSGGRRR